MARYSKYVEEHGFWNGSLWACFEEFMDAEYQDKDNMKFLLPAKDFQLWLKEHGYDIKDTTLKLGRIYEGLVN